LVLAHGAGGTLDDPLTSGLARHLRERGLGVVEATFLYRAAGRRMPDRMEVLEQTLSEVIEQASRLVGAAHVFVGGKSMGGRVAARVARKLPRVSGVCLLSYPLRPPAKVTEKNLVDRVETLRTIGLPTFVAQGTRDPFGGPDAITALVPHASVLSIEGGDHDLAIGRRLTEETLEAIAARVIAFALAQLRGSDGSRRN
jgi:predicted alpha/beta-hydrolase family hydrolase